MKRGWLFWIDRGGTFTDIVAIDPHGDLRTLKRLSENPGQYRDAAVAGIRDAMGLSHDMPISEGAIESIRMGSTVATNALLERKGARTLLIVDTGLEDQLQIGTQSRPDLFALKIKLPEPLYEAVIGVKGRLDAQGTRLSHLDESGTRLILENYRRQGFESCAIAMIHAWKYPETELKLKSLAQEAGFTHVSTSHETGAVLGLRLRGQTAILDAYLSPVLRHYVEQFLSALGGGVKPDGIRFMQSHGGLCRPEQFRGKDAVLSGPAGGVVGAVRTAQAMGIHKVIGFDMGGTSTDVSLSEGTFERDTISKISGIEISVPSLSIHTVAAGGGSMLHFDGARISVGPDSAGAYPGPKAYRRGGPLTLTDANLMTGRLSVAHFPTTFGPHADQPLDENAVIKAFAALALQIETETGQARDPRELAEGFIEVAVANMAQAIRAISIEKGHDARAFTLQCFGGAGGQLACRVAEALGITDILIHPCAGVLSAYGMGLAIASALRVQGVEIPLSDARMKALQPIIAKLKLAAINALSPNDEDGQSLLFSLKAAVKYDGTDNTLSLDLTDAAKMQAQFEMAHKKRFGFISPNRKLIIEQVSVEAHMPETHVPEVRLPAKALAAPLSTGTLWSRGIKYDLPQIDRASLRPGDHVEGPALIIDANGTTLVEPGWGAERVENGFLRLRHTPPAGQDTLNTKHHNTPHHSPDPVLLELYNNRFMAVAEQMGAVLCLTSTSVNIKERLDYSCAVFDGNGNLLANAPHVPVHLGAMSDSVRTVIKNRGATLKPGDMVVLNNPYNGGTHLPDISVIAPVFDASGRDILFFVGNRGHHADIGGITPGSTPPNSMTLEEEGVVIEDFLILSGGNLLETEFRALLETAPWPARNPDMNLADIKAQIAANHTGQSGLTALLARHGWPEISAYLGHIMDNAEAAVRKVIDRLCDGHFKTQLDDGSPLEVRISIDHTKREALIDFTGTGAQSKGNFNAPPSVTRAVVLYAFRCLVGRNLPLNEGCFKPLKLILPTGSFLSPDPGHAVVAGNTEISQAVCNALFAAMSVSAASQGTMNNFLFGNKACQYYETIGGGTGAGPDFEGASAVHSHMTNTRITDPEVLETRFPVRLDRFAIRRGSGGAGLNRGGDGMVRSLTALEPLTATIVSSNRKVGPFGLKGGHAGQAGHQWVIRADGQHIDLEACAEIDLEPGDQITIETPGGGGYG